MSSDLVKHKDNLTYNNMYICSLAQGPT